MKEKYQIWFVTVWCSWADSSQQRVPGRVSQGGAGPKGTTILLRTASSAIRPRAKMYKNAWTWVPRQFTHNDALGLAATMGKR